MVPARPISIYKITHVDSGRVYIGQTLTTVKTRWTSHVSAAINEHDGCRHFHAAIRLYGRDAFLVEHIGTCRTQKEGDWVKQHLIRFYDSVENGFNLSYGGLGTSKTHCVRGHEKIAENLAPDGKCRLCVKITRNAHREANPEMYQRLSKLDYEKHGDKRRADARAHYWQNAEAIKEQKKAKRRANPEESRRYNRRAAMKRRTKLAMMDFNPDVFATWSGKNA